jgi:hypothetical protein
MKKFIDASLVGALLVLLFTAATPQYLPLPGGVAGWPINAASYATFDLALAACPGSGQCVINFPSGTWTTVKYGGACITRSNLTLRGAGMPDYDSQTAPTSLTGGTIISPGLNFCGASHITIKDLGFDDGPAAISAGRGIHDSLIFEGASNGVTTADPNVTDINVENVSSLGSSNSAAVHSFLFEHVNGVYFSNLRAIWNTHGVVIKGINVHGYGIWTRGNSNDDLIIKGDGYTPLVGNIHVDGINGASLTTADNANGVIIDAESPSQISNVTISNAVLNAALTGVLLSSNSSFGSGQISNVSISNVVDNLFGWATGSASCLTSNGGGGYSTAINVTGMTCINATGLAAAPLQVYNSWFNSSISNWISVGAGFASTVTGTFDITNWLDRGTSAPSIPTFLASSAGTIVNVRGWSTTRGNSQTSVSGGAIINTDASGLSASFASPPAAIGTGTPVAGTFAGVTSSNGLFACGSTQVVSALSTATLFTAGSNSGLLHVRDNTLGGSALFLIDPNASTQLLGSSGVTGLAATGVTYASGWKLTLTSGAVPRTLAWCITG